MADQGTNLKAEVWPMGYPVVNCNLARNTPRPNSRPHCPAVVVQNHFSWSI